MPLRPSHLGAYVETSQNGRNGIMLTYNAYAAPSAKAPLEPFAFNPGPFGPEEHNKQPRSNNYE